MYTVKDLLESSENLQIRLIGKNLGGAGMLSFLRREQGD